MWLFGLQNCSGIIGSLLAYGISYMNGDGGLSAWRWYVQFRTVVYGNIFEPLLIQCIGYTC